MKWIIAYDISCPKRLLKVHRHLCKHALPLQNSVFLLQGSQEDYQICHQELMHLIHLKEDNLRIYSLAAHTTIIHFGKPPLPEDIVWSGMAIDIQPIDSTT